MRFVQHLYRSLDAVTTVSDRNPGYQLREVLRNRLVSFLHVALVHDAGNVPAAGNDLPDDVFDNSCLVSMVLFRVPVRYIDDNSRQVATGLELLHRVLNARSVVVRPLICAPMD